MIARSSYVEKLISKQWNGRIKIITGIRRSGKSTLLFDIYRDYLLNSGVSEPEIIEIALDDDINEVFRNPYEISEYVRKKCENKNQRYYVFLDEIQFAISKEELRDKGKPVKLYSVLNGLLTSSHHLPCDMRYEVGDSWFNDHCFASKVLHGLHRRVGLGKSCPTMSFSMIFVSNLH